MKRPFRVSFMNRNHKGNLNRAPLPINNNRNLNRERLPINYNGNLNRAPLPINSNFPHAYVKRIVEYRQNNRICM